MLKIRNNVDLVKLQTDYGFKIGKMEGVYLVYTDASNNEILIYPFADRLLEVLISPMCHSCIDRSNNGRLISISNAGVMDILTRLLKDNMIYIPEER